MYSLLFSIYNSWNILKHLSDRLCLRNRNFLILKLFNYDNFYIVIFLLRTHNLRMISFWNYRHGYLLHTWWSDVWNYVSTVYSSIKCNIFVSLWKMKIFLKIVVSYTYCLIFKTFIDITNQNLGDRKLLLLQVISFNS